MLKIKPENEAFWMGKSQGECNACYQKHMDIYFFTVSLW